MRDRELRALIAASPEDDAGYVVYADELLARGEPRGELVAIDAALDRAPVGGRAELRRRRIELLTAHPELAPPAQRGVTLRWRLGFVRGVRVDQPVEIASLLAHAALDFVTSLELTHHDRRGGGWPTQLPATLRSLALDVPVWGSDRKTPIDVDALLRDHPWVTRLATSWPVALTAAPQLRELDLRQVPREGVEALAGASLPALEALVLQPARAWSLAGDAVWPDALAPLLAHPPPRLASLELVDAPPGPELLASLAGSPLLRQLRRLAIWNSGLSAASAAVVTRQAFGHLELLDLTDIGLDTETEAILARGCPNVVRATPQLRALCLRPP